MRGSAYDPHVRKATAGPGLYKARGLPLVGYRAGPLIRCSDYRWRELFERADVMSEGAVRDETDGPVYYGSSSILLYNRSHGGTYEDDEGDSVLELLAADPHARIRAIRIACLEAQLRARRPIGCVRAELVVRSDPAGVRVNVDVEAAVVTEPARKAVPHSS